MAFWRKNRFEAPPENPQDKAVAELATLKHKRDELILHAGTDAWISRDRELLEALDEKIETLEKELERPEDYEKAA